jgi:hypothetical protein
MFLSTTTPQVLPPRTPANPLSETKTHLEGTCDEPTDNISNDEQHRVTCTEDDT